MFSDFCSAVTMKIIMCDSPEATANSMIALQKLHPECYMQHDESQLVVRSIRYAAWLDSNTKNIQQGHPKYYKPSSSVNIQYNL